MERRRTLSELYMFNLAKGIAMICVVLIHTLVAFVPQDRSNLTGLYLLPFSIVSYGMMSTFFMCSGYSFKAKPNKKFIKEKLKQILPLYGYVTIISCVSILIWRTLSGKDLIDTISYYFIPYLFAIPKGGAIGNFYVNSVGPIWFLVASLIGGIILNFILNFKKGQNLLVILSILLGWLLSFISILPFCISQSLIAVGYLYVGKIISDKDGMYLKIPKWIVVVGIGFIIVCSCFGIFDMAQDVYTLGPISILCSFIAGFFSMRLFVFWNKYSGKLWDLLKNIGFFSMGIYCAHSIELMSLPWYKIVNALSDKVWLAIPILLIGHTICIYFLNIIIKSIIKRHFTKKSLNKSMKGK